MRLVAETLVVASALFAASLASAALIGCGDGGKKPEAKKVARTPRVGTLPAPTRDLVYSVAAVGTLEALQVVAVPARADGLVETLGFEEGKPVAADTVLAVVDGTRRDQLLAQAHKAVEHASATVERLKAAIGRSVAQEAAAKAGLAEQQGMLARREAARAKAPGLVTDEEIEAVRAQIAKWQAQADEAAAATGESQAAVREAESAVAESIGREGISKRDAEDARVHPPLAGVVQARHVVVGQWVKAGDPIATLVDVSVLRLRFRVPESESVALVPGRVVVGFRVSALAGKDLSADLLYVQGSADPVSRMVECLAEVKAPDPALKPGFFASVTIDVKKASGAVVVPEESVLPTEQGLVLYVVRDGKAKASVVRLGLRTKDGWVEVVEGLAAGDVVVVENASVLKGGDTVETFPSARGATAASSPKEDLPPGPKGGAAALETPASPPAPAPGAGK